MKLKIIDPYQVTEHTIAWIELETPVGNMVIQENHAPMVVEILPKSEILFLLNNGKQASQAIVQGFAHVTREEIKILVTQQAS